MQLRATLTAILVVSAFAGAFSAAALGGGAAPAPNEPVDAPSAQAQEGQVTGENTTFQNVSLRNVTLQQVAVNRLVVNATVDGTERETTLRNVTASAVEVDNATIRNATFGRVTMNQQLATDLVGDVGTGVRPNESLPGEALEAQELSDRVLVGVEFGTLHINDASLENVTVEGTTTQDRQNIQNATVSGRGVTLTGGEAQDVTIVGLSADEPENQSDS